MPPYPYKSIGSTAAKVVSILAVSGGLLWWQRASTSYPAPQPQDEAEIMTACIERNYAMGQTNVSFVNSYAANVSQIATGTAYQALIFSSSIQSNGLNWVYSPGGINWFSWPTNQAVKGTFAYGLAYGNLGPATFFVYGTEWSVAWQILEPTNPASVYVGWFGFGGSWPDTQPATAYDFVGNELDASACGSITVDSIPGTSNNFTWATTLLKYVTNSPAYSLTNTIGCYPSAPATFLFTGLYPITILFADPTTGNPGEWSSGYPADSYLRRAGQNLETGVWWLTPTNAIIAGGSFSGQWDSYPTHYPTNTMNSPNPVFGRIGDMAMDNSYWTNWVSLPLQTWRSTTNYACTNIVWTNFPPSTSWFWQTNILWSSTGYVNHVVNSNMWTVQRNSAFKTDVGVGVFAFERDVPTNIPLPLYSPPGFVNPANLVVYWSTNVFNDFARYLSLLQWQLNANTTVSNAWVTSTTTYNYGSHSTTQTNTITYGSGVPAYLYYLKNVGFGINWECDVVTESYGATGTCTLILNAYLSNTTISNNSAFTWNNGYFYQSGSEITNTWSPANPDRAHAFGAEGFSVAPASTVSSGWWWQSPSEEQTDLNSIGATCMSIAAPYFYLAATTNSSPNFFAYYYGEQATSNYPAVFSSLPYGGWNSFPCCTYRVQFQSLTDYTKHSPAR